MKPGSGSLAGRTVLLLAMLLGILTALPARADHTPDDHEGVFSIRCGLSHRAPDDPIVHPGHKGMAHSHDFFGNRSTDANSTYDTMMDGDTSCELEGDKAGYWVPTLLKPDGAPAPVRFSLAYYRDLPVFAGPVSSFPPDFRMIAGYPNVPTGTDKVLGWSCNDSDPYLATVPDCGSRYVKLHVVYPSCWDGMNVDSPDHRSHVTYSTNGRCPDSHPVKLPRLSMHVTYDVHDGRGYYLSSDAMAGVAEGRSAHADFWNTWDPEAMERVIDACLRPGTSCLRLREIPETRADELSCLSSEVTLMGTRSPDTMSGTPAADVIASREGGDVVSSGTGADRVCGGREDDRLSGGWGRDRLAGGSHADLIAGGAGNDVLIGGPGRDVLRGGRGRDVCVGGPNKDTARGCEVRKRI
jgi:hypothetical protein